jgi:hypothetical protein
VNNHRDDIDIMARRLRTVLPPWEQADLTADLWPRMLHRIEHASPRFGWLDAALAGLIVMAAAACPEMAAVMLFHL